MKITIEQLREYQKVPNKSKVKFSWDFHWEIDILMDLVEKAIEKKIIPNFKIEYVNYWKNSLKIKINDKSESLEKLITCNFAYNKTDERYWYVDPQFLVDEISKKTKVHGMWKISILNKENIIEKFLKTLISSIEEY